MRPTGPPKGDRRAPKWTHLGGQSTNQRSIPLPAVLLPNQNAPAAGEDPKNVLRGSQELPEGPKASSPGKFFPALGTGLRPVGKRHLAPQNRRPGRQKTSALIPPPFRFLKLIFQKLPSPRATPSSWGVSPPPAQNPGRAQTPSPAATWRLLRPIPGRHMGRLHGRA